MKGIIYSELVGFLDAQGGPSFTEEVLAGAELPHGGAFSRVSRYPWEQAVQVVTSASKISSGERFVRGVRQISIRSFYRSLHRYR